MSNNNNNNETPEQKRERMRQEELKHPSSSIHGSNLADLVGGLGWKGILIILILIILVFFAIKIFGN